MLLIMVALLACMLRALASHAELSEWSPAWHCPPERTVEAGARMGMGEHRQDEAKRELHDHGADLPQLTQARAFAKLTKDKGMS